MTIRYLAAHPSAPFDNRAKKPGGADPVAEARNKTNVLRAQQSKPIRKEKKKEKNAVLSGP